MAGREHFRVTENERAIVLNAARQHPHDWVQMLHLVRQQVQGDARLQNWYNTKTFAQCRRRMRSIVDRNVERYFFDQIVQLHFCWKFPVMLD